MKFLYLPVIILLISIQTLLAQNKILDRKITVSYHQTPLKEVIEDISNRYNIRFSYSESLLPVNNKISFSCNEMVISDALEIIFSGSNYTYKVIRNQIVLYPKPASSEYNISGFVRDSATGEGLIGVVVYSENDKTGTVTNNEGFFSLRLPEGKHLIRFSYMGFALQFVNVFLKNNETLDIGMKESSTMLKEVTVTPDLKREKVLSTLGGIEKVDIRTLRKVPNLLGEPDIIRTLAFLPGVNSNELSLGEFNIRGGSANQTIFQMDEAPIPQISHFGGIFSFYNPDVVKQVVVSKGNFSASEKGALSAVVDVKLKEGNKKEWTMCGGVGTIFTRFAIEGPIKKDKTSIILAGRKSYIDQLLKLFPNLMDGEPDLYQFNDINAKIDHRFNWKNSISLAVFYGNDLIIQEDNFSLDNNLVLLKYNHYFNHQFIWETKLISSEYSITQFGNTNPQKYILEIKQSNYQWHNDFTYFLNQNFKIRTGYQAIWNENTPLSIEKNSDNSILRNFSLDKSKILDQNIFLETDLILFDRLSINAGCRGTYYMQLGPYRKHNYTYAETGKPEIIDTTEISKNDIVYTYFSPEPRISIRFLLNTSSSVKASYTRGLNFTHKLPISTVTLPIYRLMNSSSLFPPEKADNYSIGYYYSSLLNPLSASVEIYYRKMTDMVENRQNGLLLTSDQPELFTQEANGNSYGIEFSTNGNLKSIDFMLSYSYSHTRYLTDDVNNGNPYAPLFDINHSITAFVNKQIGRRFEIGLNWIFQSGLPYTEPAGIYVMDGKLVMQFDENHINTKRLPPYHRMDLSVSFTPLKNARRRWKSSWNLSVYNIYARKNPLGVTYYLENDGEKDINNREQWKPRYVYFYQFIPSISYNFKF